MASKSGGNRKVVLEIPELVAERIETVTSRTIEDVATELVLGFLQDKRRTNEAIKSLGIAWPTDWYERALRLWGERQLGERVRLLIYNDLRRDRKLKLSPMPEFKQYQPVLVDREVKPNPGRKSTIQTTVIMPDWYEALQEKYGNGNVSTYVKALIYQALEAESSPKDEPLSVPPRLSKYL